MSAINLTDEHSHPLREGLGHWVLPNRLPPPIDPALLKHSEEQAKAAQNTPNPIQAPNQRMWM